MGFFDIFKKKKEVVLEQPSVPENEYYKGHDNFYYVYNGNLDISLRICNQVNLGYYSNLYECDVRYGHTGAPVVTDAYANEDLYGFGKLVIGLDKEEMISNPNYCEFVFSKLLDRNRILELHDIEFDLAEGKKNGNYVGSVIEKDGQFSIMLDDQIGTLALESPGTKAMHEAYDKYMAAMAKQKAEFDERASIARKEKIERLKEELESLNAQEEKYQGSKNK